MAQRKHPRLHVNVRLAALFLTVLLLLVGYREYQRAQERKSMMDLPGLHEKGELRALMLYSPTSYFIYRDKPMGYEYELCSKMAEDLGMKLRVVVAPSVDALTEMLIKGEGDLIASNLPITRENKRDFRYCGREFLTHQVLVQRKRLNLREMAWSVTDLVNKTVVVHENSRYHKRLLTLNDELGGGVNIQSIPSDSLSVEELIGLVAMGKIDFTVADNTMAQFNQTFYKNLNVNLNVSFSQQSSWAVRKDAPLLADAVDEWFLQNSGTEAFREISDRYFEVGKDNAPYLTSELFQGKPGQISPWDELFQRHADAIGWDWRLLASIAWQESNFNPSVVNWTGARGLMQIMPRTARSVGVDKDSLFKPEHNVLAAARLLKTYERSFARIQKADQRLKLTLAAYNSGLGHVLDARALARKHGANPNIWDNGNVQKFILLKSRPEYYDDPVCKQGYLRGSETSAFVDEVWSRYLTYLKNTSQHKSKRKKNESL